MEEDDDIEDYNKYNFLCIQVSNCGSGKATFIANYFKDRIKKEKRRKRIDKYLYNAIHPTNGRWYRSLYLIDYFNVYKKHKKLI